MKKIVFLLFLILSFSCGLFADLPPGIGAIVQRKKLIVAIYSKDIFPLFYHNDQGQLTGHEVDLAREIASALGVDLEFNRNAESFDAVIDTVLSGDADIGISLLSMTPQRVMRVRFSDPYLKIHPVLIINRLLASGVNEKNLMEELNDQSVVLSEKKGTSYVNMAESFFPESGMILADNWDDVVLNVVHRRAGFSMRDEIGVTNLIQEHKDLLVNLKLKILSDVNDYIGIAVRPEDRQLQYWINVFLEQHEYPIEAKELFQRYRR